MKYRKNIINDWFKWSFNISHENKEFDEVAWMWKNPEQVQDVVCNRRVEHNETH